MNEKSLERMRKLRVARGLSQRQLGQVMSVSQGVYSRYQLGTREPDMAFLISLADFYRVSLDYMCGRVDTPYYIIKDESGAVVASTDDPTIPKKALAQISFAWPPSSLQEFKRMVMQVVNGDKSND